MFFRKKRGIKKEEPVKKERKQTYWYDNSKLSYSEEKGMARGAICPVWDLELESSQDIIRIHVWDHIMHEKCLNKIEKTEEKHDRWFTCFIILTDIVI